MWSHADESNFNVSISIPNKELTTHRYPINSYLPTLCLNCTEHIPYSRWGLRNTKKNAATDLTLFKSKIRGDTRGQGNLKSVSQVNKYLRDYYEFPTSFQM